MVKVALLSSMLLHLRVVSTFIAKSPSLPYSSRSLGVVRMSSTDSKTVLLNCPTIPLRDGTSHPAIGFGTYKVGFIPASASSAAASPAPTSVERTAEECVSDALDVGYRFLECAEFYGNEAEVGKAIAKSGIDRKDLFICSKVWTTTIEKGPAAVRAQLEKTLKDLQTTYVDLYLIHWPVPVHHVEAYKTLVELQKEGKVKGIGVSNYGKSSRRLCPVLLDTLAHPPLSDSFD
jgi:diketogulonate reductase-like aldo/keto reductase